MTPEATPPPPLGWCVQCLLSHEQTAAETVFEGDAVCLPCLNDLTGAADDEESTPSSA